MHSSRNVRFSLFDVFHIFLVFYIFHLFYVILRNFTYFAYFACLHFAFLTFFTVLVSESAVWYSDVETLSVLSVFAILRYRFIFPSFQLHFLIFSFFIFVKKNVPIFFFFFFYLFSFFHFSNFLFFHFLFFLSFIFLFFTIILMCGESRQWNNSGECSSRYPLQAF